MLTMCHHHTFPSISGQTDGYQLYGGEGRGRHNRHAGHFFILEFKARIKNFFIISRVYCNNEGNKVVNIPQFSHHLALSVLSSYGLNLYLSIDR